MQKRDPKQKQDNRDQLASNQTSDESVRRKQPGVSRSEAGQTDEEAIRDTAQSHHYRGEAQNVSADERLQEGDSDLEHARNKAMEGQKQNRQK